METHQISSALREDKLVNRIWFNYFPYWPLFLILLFLINGTAWTYLRFAPSVYESNSAIIIKDGKKGIEDSKIIGEINQLAAPTIVENEIEVLRSRLLIGEVIKNLKLYAPVFKGGKIWPLSVYSTSPIKIEVNVLDSLKEVKKVYFEYDESKNIVLLGSHQYQLDQWQHTPYGTLRFIKNSNKGEVESQLFFSLVNPKEVVLDLLSKLDISSNKLSSVVSLKIQDEDPRRAEDILNELIAVYNLAALNEKNILAKNTIAFIEKRLNFISKDLDSIEFNLQQYKSQKGAVDISEQGKIFLENVSANDQKLGDINMQLAILKQVEEYVVSKGNKEGIVPSTLGVENPTLNRLLDKLYNNELQYENLKQTTGANSPILLSILDQIEKIKPSILEIIGNQKLSLEISKSNLTFTNGGYNSFLQGIPQKERQLLEINREQNIKSFIYSFLLQKREEATLSQSLVPDSRIIDKAESTLAPVSPKPKLVYLLAIGLSFFLGFIIISARQMFNRSILFRHQISEITNFSIIGEILLDKSRTNLVMEKGKRSMIAEQFRKLRTSLGFIGIGNNKKKLLITSTLSGEGKSFITANLGLSLAQTGKKVVIIEFDLSNPTLASKLISDSKLGLVEYLNGTAQAVEIINPTDANKNLYLIPSGNLPEDPSDLIVKSKVEELFGYLEDSFDYILVDTAPVGLLSDAYVLSRLCDATLFVVRHNYTPIVLLKRLDEENKVNELKNLAIVFNAVSSRGFGKNDVYGYGYGYGYFERKKEKRVRILSSRLHIS